MCIDKQAWIKEELRGSTAPDLDEEEVCNSTILYILSSNTMSSQTLPLNQQRKGRKFKLFMIFKNRKSKIAFLLGFKESVVNHI